jgi:hypothetical protein
MKKLLVLALSLLTCANTQACSEISGKYITVSETEWNYSLLILDEKAILHYSTHEHTENEEEDVVEIEGTENGVCKIINGNYLLTFGGKQYPFEFHTKLSHKSFGKLGASPGLKVENLIPGLLVEFWLEGTVE